jgi:integrase
MYLERRYRTFYALHDIPADLRASIGRKRFVASLRTQDIETAKTRAALLESTWRAAIERARGTSTAHLEGQAGFYRAALRHASPAEREAIMSQLTDEAAEIALEGDGVPFTEGEDAEARPGYKAGHKLIQLATGALVRFDEHLAGYLDTKRNLEVKTLATKRATITMFAADFPYIADVTRKSVQTWVNKQPQAAATIRRALSECRGYWRYLISLEIAPEETAPFDKIVLPAVGKGARQDERRPFSAGEVLQLLDAAKDDGQIHDLITLAMWTGCRIEELCALKVEKVGDGYIEIADAKTAAGWRQVPIHSRLQQTIARLLETSGDGYVLSGLTINKNGDRSNVIGRRFSRFKTALGFNSQHVFHSIRKTVATLLEDAGVIEGIAADILGHEKKTMTYGLYSGGTSLKTKRAAIERLSYGERRMTRE